jgi:hypothetical protein
MSVATETEPGPAAAEDSFLAACDSHRRGDAATALAGYRAVLSRDPEHRPARLNLAVLHHCVGDYEAAIAELEILLAQDPCNEKGWRSLAWARLRQRLARAVAVQRVYGHHAILLAAMPKSGSTYFCEALASLPGMRRAHLVMGYEHHEQELVLDHLLTYAGTDYVAQHHLRHSEATEQLCALFALRPIVLVRNIFDAMASLRDHLMRFGLDFSMARVDPAFRGWDEGRQYRFIAEMMMPWFVTFYVGWSRAADRLILSYEDLLENPVALVTRAARHAGLAVSADDARAALAAARTRPIHFNRGVSGRGRSLPAAARQRVLDQLAFYPDVDFAPLLRGEAGRPAALAG